MTTKKPTKGASEPQSAQAAEAEQTETTTFTDCVNCLIAFTNNPHSLDVALNSIAFLRWG